MLPKYFIAVLGPLLNHPLPLKVEAMPDITDELAALLVRISSPEARRAGDALFSVDPPDLSITYSPDNFGSPDTQPGSNSNSTICKK